MGLAGEKMPQKQHATHVKTKQYGFALCLFNQPFWASPYSY
jgi:hypothetical protein